MLGLRLAALSLALFAPSGELPPEIASAYGTIRGERILPTVRFLASPRLEGRESGTRGCEVAADFLSSAYQAAGLEPGSKEGYLQSFDLVRRTLAREAELTVKRTVAGATSARSLQVRTDWVPFGFSEVGTAEAPVVFAGYGIVAREFGWDDYAALPPGGVKGRIVVVFRHEPDENGTAGSKFFEGREMTLHASLRQKAREAASRGALGLVIVDDPANHEPAANPSSSLSRWTIPTEEERSLARDDPKRPRGRAAIQRDDEPLGILAALASQEILRVLDPGRDWKALQQEMDASRKPKGFALPDMSVKMVHAFEVERDPTANVLAVLPGSDPVLSKEYVLVGGHYDHVGKSETTQEIYPGADDNASGTAAVLAVAQAFAALPKAPARSVLFASWSGEEMGLLGSERFVRKP
ncbi:MAG TPA: M28 family peptidase, partial [Candidatus Polarisedimenticolaceae bacterium]|nr:M28 family peptidase [Candidatus Polarisedimenticolaceae bacterium]